MIKRRRHQRAGFSWVEMLAIVTILGIIAAIIVPRVTVSKEAAARHADRRNKAEINAAAERWYVEKGSWPKDDLQDIGADPAYFPHGLPTHPVNGSAYSLDSATHRVR